MRSKVLSYVYIIAFTFSFYNFYSATCVSNGNGAWDNAATWSCGAVPGCGDSIVILSGHTVTITTQTDYNYCGSGSPLAIAIYGTLKFTNGNKLKLPCNSRIYVFSGGKIEPGTGGGNSNYIEICDDIEWNAASGTYTGPGCMPSNHPSCSAVLPVELLDFSAAINDNKNVDIIWITALEKNNDYFEIQKSKDAQLFENAGMIKSKAPNGNSQLQLNYLFEDTNPIEAISYYRLKQVDLDGSYTYSKMVSVNYIKEKNVRFVIYPNPNKGEFTADISGLENNHKVIITLRGERGKLVYDSTFYIQDSISSKLKIIPTEKLESGMYICTLSCYGIEYHVKVLVN